MNNLSFYKNLFIKYFACLENFVLKKINDSEFSAQP